MLFVCELQDVCTALHNHEIARLVFNRCGTTQAIDLLLRIVDVIELCLSLDLHAPYLV